MSASPGLPPQVRGRDAVGHLGHAHGGTTPAGAGTSTAMIVLRGRLADYPRRCGDERSWLAKELAGTGLPPQVRGRDAVG